MKKILKEWKRFLIEEQINSVDSQHQANMVASETKMAEDALLDTAMLEEQPATQIQFVSNVDIIDKDAQQDFAKAFYKSYNLSNKKGFLTPYSIEEFVKMKLFMVKTAQGTQNAGFAIKDGNDIVSVHNNSGIRGIGNQMIEEAKRQGGTKLDHFDGFLSGYYRKHGFKVSGLDQWSEQYIPEGWDFPTSNIEDPRSSVYAEATTKFGQGYEKMSNIDRIIKIKVEGGVTVEANPADKTSQYRSGRPDVIYRKL